MKNSAQSKLLKFRKKRYRSWLIVLFAQVLLSGVCAQTTNISIQQKNVTVKEILAQVEKKGQVVFFYADNDVDLNRKVSINLINQPITKVLEDLFKNSQNTFKLSGKQVYITKRSMPVEAKPKSETKKQRITGVVVDENKQTVIGASIKISGTNLGTVTDIDGRFSIEAPENAQLIISYVGYEAQTVDLKDKTIVNISLNQSLKILQEVIVVGYGLQKKQSVVGAIVQAKGSDLARTGVYSSVGQALTGLLPGVSTATVTGMPGAEDPKITIRGLSSWNGSSPLVLIDGVERQMSDIDVGQIESISVLKDASATAVFGVKGAEGVILITSKRGKEGKAQISFSTNSTFKSISRIPDKLDSYDTFAFQNEVLEKQNPSFSNSWGWYLPQDVLNKYRYPANVAESELYPNVNWAEEIVKDFAITQRYDVNITGGTSFAKYFAALSYLKDDDLLKSGLDVGLPYKPKWGFEHYNFRSNLDFNLTKTTVLSTNLAGSIRKKDGYDNGITAIWGSFYQLSPSDYPVRYQDGTFGFNVNRPADLNPVKILSGSSGLSSNYTTQIFTDFELKQDLDFITKGLSAKASLSYDNRLYSSSSISNINLLSKSVDKDGNVVYNPLDGGNQFDFYSIPGYIGSETFSTQATVRKLYYKAQINYSRTFGKNDVSALGLMSREELTSGSEFPHYREDWVGRFTYGYNDKYFVEANGAYNGSEKFDTKYRFGFFPSIGLGWMISNESFLKKSWVDKLKLRYSIGTVGSDNFASQRWSYDTQWGLDGGDVTTFGTTYTSGDVRTGTGATYLQYKEAVIGNPDLHWEVSRKQNLGLDFSIFKGVFSGSVELFQDDRSDVFMTASQLTSITPSYLGAAPVSANIGKVQNKGYELELKLQQTWAGVHCWLSYNFAHAKDLIIYSNDPELKPDYQKREGFQIGQPKVQVEQDGFTTSWDDLYGSVAYESNSGRLPGDVVLIDYNCDGVADGKDAIPYGYPNRPQNTYNTSLGIDYKGFNFMVQLFGVYNVSQNFNSIIYLPDNRSPYLNPLLTDYWTPTNTDATFQLVRAGGTATGQSAFTRGRRIDGSYTRLKNLEIAYTFSGQLLKSLNVSSLKLTLSGNNLILWTKMPEDKEQEVDIWATSESSYNLYPTTKRINLGLSVTF